MSPIIEENHKKKEGIAPSDTRSFYLYDAPISLSFSTSISNELSLSSVFLLTYLFIRKRRSSSSYEETPETLAKHSLPSILIWLL